MKPHIILRYLFIDDSCFGAGVYASYVKYDELKSAEELAGSNQGTDASEKQLLEMKNTWLAFMIISAVVLVIVVLLVIFLRDRIRLAVALIKEASK